MPQHRKDLKRCVQFFLDTFRHVIRLDDMTFGLFSVGQTGEAIGTFPSVKVKLHTTWVLQYWGGRTKYCTFVFQKKAFVVGWSDVQ